MVTARPFYSVLLDLAARLPPTVLSPTAAHLSSTVLSRPDGSLLVLGALMYQRFTPTQRSSQQPRLTLRRTVLSALGSHATIDAVMVCGSLCSNGPLCNSGSRLDQRCCHNWRLAYPQRSSSFWTARFRSTVLTTQSARLRPSVLSAEAAHTPISVLSMRSVHLLRPVLSHQTDHSQSTVLIS